MFIFAILFALLMVLPGHAAAGNPEPLPPRSITATQPVAIDGDSIVWGLRRIRLWGIDAPELRQTCDGQPVGRQAKARLAALIAGGIDCGSRGRDRYGRELAVCGTAAVPDINRIMVREGYAFAYRRYTAYYVSEEGRGPVRDYRCANPESYRHGK